MSSENAYEALTEAVDDSRWAFGTGFDDPLSGVDTTVPSDVDTVDLAAYCVMLGDDALVFSHRLQQWCTHLPELEDEVAVANIALDLLGAARLLLVRASKVGGAHGPYTESSEDSLAFFRAEHQFRNVRLVEGADADFGELCARLLVFSTWRLALLRRLTGSRDPVLSAIAAKGVKELTYHRDYAAGWVLRLGDGTEYSKRRMQSGMDSVWPLLDELFGAHQVERRVAGSGVGVDPAALREECDEVFGQVLAEATLDVPQVAPMATVAGRAGRDGVHTEAMGFLLAELQSVARAHPGARW